MFLKIIALAIIIFLSRVLIGWIINKTVDRFSLLVKGFLAVPGISFFMASILATRNGLINIPIMLLCWVLIGGGHAVFVLSRMK